MLRIVVWVFFRIFFWVVELFRMLSSVVCVFFSASWLVV